MKAGMYSILSNKAKLGENVVIGDFVTIHDNVIIGDNTIIESYCEMGVSNKLSKGQPLQIGSNSHIRSHCIFYEGSIFGDELTTGHRVTVREKTFAGKGCQLGTLSDVQGHCEIGNYVKIHSNVHIGQHSKIGNYVWIFPYVVLTNDPHPPSNILMGVTLHDFSVVATMSVILPGTIVAQGCLVGAHSLLSGKTEEDMIYSGNPAKKIGPTNKIKLKDGSRKPAYPWRRHFTRGYPQDIINSWNSEIY